MSAVQPKLHWVQSLRGIAVLLVVLTHARYVFLDTPTWALANDLFFPGASGVDLFFIISGFIMVYTTRRSDGSPAYALEFLIKRFARIWPVYAVATLAWVLVAFEGLGFFHKPHALHILALSLAFQPVDLNAPLYFGMALPLGWTLNFEMYFYIVFAISLLFGRFRWGVLAAWILATVIALPMATRGLTLDVLTNFHYSPSYLNLVTNPIILEFLGGAAIGCLYMQSWFSLASRALCMHLVFLSLCLFIWYAYGGIGNFHGPTRWGWALAFVVMSLALASKTVEITPPSWLAWLGTISYSLYLTHTLVQHIVGRAVEWAGGSKHSWTYILLSTAVAISVAALAHRYLEEKLSRSVRNILLRLFRRYLKQHDKGAQAQQAGARSAPEA